MTRGDERVFRLRVSDMYDVPKEQYVTVIREMIRHENDLTNHRTMWLLVVQGLLVNAYVSARGGGTPVIVMLSLVGILVTVSSFVKKTV